MGKTRPLPQQPAPTATRPRPGRRRRYLKRAVITLAAVVLVLILASLTLFFAFARYVIFDMTLAFFVCAAIFSGYIAADQNDFAGISAGDHGRQ